ncbi:hypothetical protein, partial [Oryzifoliimicrobium ureilyticus]|uniref:hypothetical protein n=1 Tax=Oryzifoliimicrobium ureilyticus TaxID=3113724 RepID=UPI0030763548
NPPETKKRTACGPLQFGKPSETIVQRTDGSALSTMTNIYRLRVGFSRGGSAWLAFANVQRFTSCLARIPQLLPWTLT